MTDSHSPTWSATRQAQRGERRRQPRRLRRQQQHQLRRRRPDRRSRESWRFAGSSGNQLTSLMLADGVPLMLAGDEVGNSQNGNNNAYCQDNPIGWVDWGGLGPGKTI